MLNFKGFVKLNFRGLYILIRSNFNLGYYIDCSGNTIASSETRDIKCFCIQIKTNNRSVIVLTK